MMTQPVTRSAIRIHDSRRELEATRDLVAEEARHDALQSVGTILALLEAGNRTVDDPQVTTARLAQIEGEVLGLRSLLRNPVPGDPLGTAAAPATSGVDVAAETGQLVSAATVGWTGTVGVVADTSARTTVSSTGLRRILGNVLRNAVRAAGPHGQVRVTVSPAGGEVQIEVEDDGPGFGALPVQNGVGLRSVRRLVQQAGGWLEAGGPSRLGGAAVRIHLPAAGTGAAS
jgi:signal transduction histidine kinase